MNKYIPKHDYIYNSNKVKKPYDTLLSETNQKIRTAVAGKSFWGKLLK